MSRRLKGRASGFNIAIYILFIILAALTIFPFYNVLILSVANTISYTNNIPYLFPYTIDFSGFREVLFDSYFLKSLLVTIFVTVVGTFLNITFSILTAYALSKKKLAGRKFLLKFILFTMLFSGGLVPTYLVISKLGLLNSVWSMILPTMLNTYFIIIMKNYFESIPSSLEEAAIIDGANDYQILVKIYLPVSKPVIATFTLFYAVARWNEWWNAYLYITDKNIKPLQIYLRDVFATYNSQLAPQLQSMMEMQVDGFPLAVQMATIIITIVPILCVYPFIQKYFIKGVMSGAIKE